MLLLLWLLLGPSPLEQARGSDVSQRRHAVEGSFPPGSV